MILLEILEARHQASYKDLHTAGILRQHSPSQSPPRGWVRVKTTHGGKHPPGNTFWAVRKSEVALTPAEAQQQKALIADATRLLGSAIDTLFGGGK